MDLIIVESPTKARTLSRFLGKDFSVEATMGHIKDLPKAKLSVDVENNFKPDYVLIPKKADSVEAIRKSALKAEKVFLATDPDREGEAISAHVKEILGNGDNKNLERIVFHEITKEAVEEALSHPRKIDRNLVHAQIARRVLDRLVGYKLSPLLWKKIRRGLSAGRVQSVAVRLIVEREREIEAFVPVEFWEIFCKVKSQKSEANNEFNVQLVKINNNKAEIKNKEEADIAVSDLEKAGYKVFDLRKREVRKNPYPPFTTSTMTQAAARIFGWSAKKTMSFAQRLYEEGLITYHRTDSTNLSQAAVSKAREYIEKTYGKEYVPATPRIFKTKSKLAQEAHEAIRPTDAGLTHSQFTVTGSLTPTHQKLYELIWKRFIACQMSASIFDETVIDVLAVPISPNRQNINYLLRAGGQVIKFDGWRRVIPLSKEEEPELPLVQKDEELDLLDVLSEQKFTQPPPRYNEASLIKMLEKLGIGRPSTYAPIISTIQVRNYVEKSEGKFMPTPIGVAVNDFLVLNFPGIVDFSFTAEMEDKLDGVAKGELKWQVMMGDFYTPFDKKLKDVEKTSKRIKIEAEKLGRKCPTCEKEGRTGDKQGDLVIRVGRFGKFVSCSNFPECKHTEKYIVKLDMKCPDCKKGEVIVKSTRRGKKFYGCSRYPKCKWASWRKPGTEKAEDKKEN